MTIDKSKFQLANDADISIKDTSFTGKPVGYFKDAWGRFKKNRLSVYAFAVIIVLAFFTFFGPYFRNYDLNVKSAKEAMSFSYLTPRIPVLENIGIFNGSRKMNGLSESTVDSWPEGVIISKSNRRELHGDTVVDVKINSYAYTAYRSSNEIIILSQPEFLEHQRRNAIIEVVNISGTSYQVRVDIFQYSFGTTYDNTYFWFGTDDQGGDLFTELWKGARISILMAVVITVINIIIGVIVGAIVGYYGGTLDILFERFIDILVNIPFIAILSILVLRYGSAFWVIIIAFVATGWIGSYGSTRIQMYRYKNREFVLSARTYGASDFRIIFRHILPNAIGTLITAFSLSIPAFIFTESNFSFLQIIQYENATGVGELVTKGQAAMQSFPHLLIFPAVFISLLMLSFTLFSNGLRDGFNPALRGVEE